MSRNNIPVAFPTGFKNSNWETQTHHSPDVYFLQRRRKREKNYGKEKIGVKVCVIPTIEAKLNAIQCIHNLKADYQQYLSSLLSLEKCGLAYIIYIYTSCTSRLMVIQIFVKFSHFTHFLEQKKHVRNIWLLVDT